MLVLMLMPLLDGGSWQSWQLIQKKQHNAKQTEAKHGAADPSQSPCSLHSHATPRPALFRGKVKVQVQNQVTGHRWQSTGHAGPRSQITCSYLTIVSPCPALTPLASHSAYSPHTET
jgi:hypothetical protein